MIFCNRLLDENKEVSDNCIDIVGSYENHCIVSYNFRDFISLDTDRSEKLS